VSRFFENTTVSRSLVRVESKDKPCIYFHCRVSCFDDHTLYPATQCNTLQHTATHCNTLQHTATHCNSLQQTAGLCHTKQHTAHTNSTLHTHHWPFCLGRCICCNTVHKVWRTATQCTNCGALLHTAQTAAHCNILHIHSTQESSWKQVFYLICTIHSDLTFFPDLYHYHVSRGRYALVSSGRVRHPISKMLFVRIGQTFWERAVYCNTLQHITNYCSTLQHTVHPSLAYFFGNALYTATRCNTLQHAATHCNTLHTLYWHIFLRTCCIHFFPATLEDKKLIPEVFGQFRETIVD